uniref:SJCHGC09798 protein n=1 Tax=Schistosoma japonicum TaxID=6182 RepID=Q5BQV1_SCHJA|nr:SJCHGC09798 protein [Schistosoma japonicum]
MTQSNCEKSASIPAANRRIDVILSNSKRRHSIISDLTPYLRINRSLNSSHLSQLLSAKMRCAPCWAKLYSNCLEILEYG